jgi:hypothetical protein
MELVFSFPTKTTIATTGGASITDLSFGISITGCDYIPFEFEAS